MAHLIPTVDPIEIDEDQDFVDLWRVGIDKVYRDPDAQGLLHILYDPKQNIYVEWPSLPSGLGPPFVLPTNCRSQS